MNKENFDFTEEWDKEPLDEYDIEWAMAAIRRHYRFVGIRRYTGKDTNNQWFKSLHLQIFKWDKEIIRWNIKKGLW